VVLALAEGGGDFEDLLKVPLDAGEAVLEGVLVGGDGGGSGSGRLGWVGCGAVDVSPLSCEAW
jgi:hypothetical protein